MRGEIVFQHIIWRLYLEPLSTQDAQLAVPVYSLLQANRNSLLSLAIDFLSTQEKYEQLSRQTTCIPRKLEGRFIM